MRFESVHRPGQMPGQDDGLARGWFDWPYIEGLRLDEAMNELAINEISQPIKTQFGWHILQVTGRRDQDQTEERKRERARRILQNRKFEEELEAWVRELRDESYVKILEEEEA